MLRVNNVSSIIGALSEEYGTVKPFLVHRNEFELLICVILSAQTLDATVNKVSPDLFKHYPNSKLLSQANVEDVATIIKSINYYKTKARNIVSSAKLIEDNFNGVVPNILEELMLLPGVGRKVANVVLADWFSLTIGVVVDTHVKRVSYRIGWTKHTDPFKIEQDLIGILPKDSWINVPKQLILVGRNYCFPKKPDCKNCPIAKYCQKHGVNLS